MMSRVNCVEKGRFDGSTADYSPIRTDYHLGIFNDNHYCIDNDYSGHCSGGILPSVATSIGSRLIPVLARFFVLALLLLCVCADDPDDDSAKPAVREYGALELCVRVVNQPLKKVSAQSGIDAASAVAQTIAENIVVEISGNDLSPTQFMVRLDPSRPTLVDTVKKVPIGEARKISVWAVNKDGAKTHIDTIEYRYADIEKAAVTRIYATLIPAAGSIYVHINGLETAISTVYASFTSRSGELVFRNSAARASHTFLSIDNIPHELDGILRVSLVDTKGDTLRIATKEFVFNARSDNAFELQFIENSGMLAVEAALYAPGVAMLSYDFEKSVSDVVETGELIITEIMFSAGDDNYIELYNPKNAVVFLDTLVIEVDKTSYYCANVSIGPSGYFVISRRAALYANVSANTTGGLPITSTGNWITVKRGRTGAILDRVICGGTNSAVGWPSGLSSSSKRAVELNLSKYGAIDNNYGKNWAVAVQAIEGTAMYGTPGR